VEVEQQISKKLIFKLSKFGLRCGIFNTFMVALSEMCWFT